MGHDLHMGKLAERYRHKSTVPQGRELYKVYYSAHKHTCRRGTLIYKSGLDEISHKEINEDK